jgi:hypothetical protein
MDDGNTQIKDLTEIERMIIGSSTNFVFNLINNQLYHIENHDPELLELLNTNERAQEDYILLQNLRNTAEKVVELFGGTFSALSDDDKETLSKPAIKLEEYFQGIFHIVSCDGNN